MKKIIGIIGIALLASCSVGDQLRDFIPGTYVRTDSGEFSMAEDTLAITFSSGDIYSISRRTGYRKIRDRKLMPKEFRSEEMNGHFEPGTGQLTETRRGRVLTFQPKDMTLLLEASKYKKIK